MVVTATDFEPTDISSLLFFLDSLSKTSPALVPPLIIAVRAALDPFFLLRVLYPSNNYYKHFARVCVSRVCERGEGEEMCKTV